MYPEFILIYAGLLVIIVLLIVILILIVIRTSKGTPKNVPVTRKMQVSGAAGNKTATIVFCKNCATQFDSSQRYCPNCGTPRQ